MIDNFKEEKQKRGVGARMQERRRNNSKISFYFYKKNSILHKKH